MVARTDDGSRTPLPRRLNRGPARRPARLPAIALAAGVAVALVAGVTGGLLRAGVPLTADPAPWHGAALVSHAALMMCAFFGTAIGVERAVAIRRRAAYLGPFASALGGLAALAGYGDWGAWLFVGAAVAFVAVNAMIVGRQAAAHTWLLLLAALSWLGGNVMHALQTSFAATIAAWFAFLVLTIAAERLEMSRLMPARRGARLWFHAAVLALMAGVATSVVSARAGGIVFGAALCVLAGWLGAYDIARRTVRAAGITRYIAVCLLGGYVWLAVGGLAWAATATGWPARDAALHAIGLGFVFSMVMGHALVILPAVARIKVQYGWPFYVPLALLHASLVARLGPGAFETAWRVAGSALNGIALAVFAATIAGGAIAWRRRHAVRRQENVAC